MPRMFCSECEEEQEVSAFVKSCQVCGTKFICRSQEIPLNTSLNDNISTNNEFSLEDFFNSDFFREIQTTIEPVHEDLSPVALKNLGVLTVDKNRYLLFDSRLQIGSLSFLAIPALFSPPPIPQSVISGKIIFGNPDDGAISENENKLINSSECSGNIVMLKRGKISFAKKSLISQSSGSILTIICQTYDTYPFAMTDSSQEIKINSFFHSLHIPVVMVSKNDSSVIENLLAGASKRGLSLSCEFHAGECVTECSICSEEMIFGQEILKLYCRHVFHNNCIKDWIKIKTNCPLCRTTLIRNNNLNNNGEEEINQNQELMETIRIRRRNEENNNSQPYFV